MSFVRALDFLPCNSEKLSWKLDYSHIIRRKYSASFNQSHVMILSMRIKIMMVMMLSCCWCRFGSLILKTTICIIQDIELDPNIKYLLLCNIFSLQGKNIHQINNSRFLLYFLLELLLYSWNLADILSSIWLIIST